MVNRVVLGAFDGTYVLRGSRPGFNVLSTGLTTNQLAFDSRWSELNNILMTGSVVIPAGNFGIDIPFPAGLTVPPLVFAMLTGPAQATSQVNPIQSLLDNQASNDTLALAMWQSENGAHPMLRFTIYSTGFTGERRVTYTIMRNPYG